MGRERTIRVVLWRRAAVWTMLLVTPLGLAADTSREYDVKAAFLLNFAKFVDWPQTSFAGPDSPIAICILGKDPFGTGLDDLVQGEVVNGRRLVVHRIARAPVAKSCQIVFTQQSRKESGEVLTNLGPGILTVGEGESFIREGGIIAFHIENRHVRFDIDRKAAEAANLKLSSKLLAVARSVHR